MPDAHSDEIAREAARLMQTGRAKDIDDALHRAAESLGYERTHLPGHGRVRKHAQAMAMQAMGDAAYHELRVKIWRIAEQVMTCFEHTMPEAMCEFVGRAAEGLIDAGVTIHIRLYTRHSDVELAKVLLDFGYDEPQFQTIETRFGRMQQIRFTEEGVEVALTRVMPELASKAAKDLVTDKPIEKLSLSELRRLIDLRSK